MGKILDFNKFKKKKEKDEEPHYLWGLGFCWSCRHEWFPYFEYGTDENKLECPSCGEFDSKYIDGEELYKDLKETIEAMNKK